MMRTNNLKRILCLLLAALMLISVLTACNKETTENPQKSESSNEPTDSKPTADSTDTPKPVEKPSDTTKPDKKDPDASSGYQTLAEQTGYGYLASYQPLNLGMEVEYAYGLQKGANGRLWLRATVIDGVGNYVQKYFTMLPDGTDVQELKMPKLNENENVTQICFAEDGMWLATYEWNWDGEVYPIEEPIVVYGEGVKGDEATDEPPLSDDWTQSTEGDGWVDGDTNINAEEGEDDPWIDFDDPAEPEEPVVPGSSSEIYRLYKVDAEGNIVAQPDIEPLRVGTDYFYINSMVPVSDGLLLLCDQALFHLDETGKLVNKLTVDNWIDNVVQVADDRIAVSYYGEEGRVFAWVDPATMELGEPIKLATERYYSMVPGGGSYDLYMNDDNVLAGYKLDTGEITPLLNWMDSDVSSYEMNGWCVVDESTIIFLYNEEGGGMEIGTLSRVPFDQIPSRETITFGGMWLDYEVRRMISKFNRTNEQYRITFADYSQYQTEENYNAGYERLNMDMASGKGPDMLMADSQIDMANYINKHLLANLYDFMGEGKTWKKEDLSQGYRSAMEIDGGLYALCGGYGMGGMWTKAEYAGDDGVLSLDEMLAAARQIASAGGQLQDYYTTKQDALYTILSVSHDALIDSTTGECHFDTPEFAKLLEYCNLFPAEIDWENVDYDYSNVYNRVRAGQALFAGFSLYGFSDLKWTLADMHGVDDLVLVGYPSVNGTTFMAYDNGNGLMINANSPYQDICWEFISQLLGDEYQKNNSWMLSARQDMLEEQAAAAIGPSFYYDENGEKVEYEDTWWNDETQQSEPLPPLTQEQVDYFMDIVDHASCSRSCYDEELNTVVQEEAAAYFAGQKPAEEVARLIQSRVQIYVNEQR